MLRYSQDPTILQEVRVFSLYKLVSRSPSDINFELTALNPHLIRLEDFVGGLSLSTSSTVFTLLTEPAGPPMRTALHSPSPDTAPPPYNWRTRASSPVCLLTTPPRPSPSPTRVPLPSPRLSLSSILFLRVPGVVVWVGSVENGAPGGLVEGEEPEVIVGTGGSAGIGPQLYYQIENIMKLI
ncbi:hypothetical protein JB92DRAFT_3132416 [Gautieria morchelliformis]|nr:hypothetical protein JB92DRAFT_3132416 [Gautieria morchelliformis]